jgi:DNA-binding CsgD family transcriptional regulator
VWWFILAEALANMPTMQERAAPNRNARAKENGQVLCLVIRGMDPSLWHYCVRQGRQTIGRSTLCDLRIMHTSVSRLHADIRWEKEGLTLRDMNSQNGTFVNDRRISQGMLEVGDSLQLGSVVLDVVLLQPGKKPASEISTDQHAVHGSQEPSIGDRIARAELSRAQEQVLLLLAQGLSEKQVAAKLRISRHTVHAHVKNIYRALGVHSRVELLSRFWTQPGN